LSAIVLVSITMRGGAWVLAMAAPVARSAATDGRLDIMTGTACATLSTSGSIQRPAYVMRAVTAGSGSYP